nr:MAG TPA: SOS-response transcriptional repressor [Caudoviricetes sp.]
MSRRKTVALNLDFALSRIRAQFRSNVVFCEAMGFGNRSSWVSDWKRGKNLPSPEEAAKMCAVLQVRPEDLLATPDDIKIVRDLLESEVKKEPPAEVGEQLSPLDSRWFSLTDEEKLQAWEYIVQLRAKKQGGSRE